MWLHNGACELNMFLKWQNDDRVKMYFSAEIYECDHLSIYISDVCKISNYSVNSFKEVGENKLYISIFFLEWDLFLLLTIYALKYIVLLLTANYLSDMRSEEYFYFAMFWKYLVKYLPSLFKWNRKTSNFYSNFLFLSLSVQIVFQFVRWIDYKKIINKFARHTRNVN